MSEVVPSFCRTCLSFCPILVTLEDGKPVKIAGDRLAPLYDGYTCPKGRALADQHGAPTRLLTSMVRQQDGRHVPIESGRAMAEIAERVRAIIGRHGPRSVALYFGTGSMSFMPAIGVAVGWMQAIGSPMIFTANTIDKPGAQIAQAAHGHWPAGQPAFDQAQAWMLIGVNPVISKSGGFPPNNPAKRLKEAVVDRGMKLIVIDPRRTESADRAHVHLQARPGTDPVILAAMIHVILERELFDREFVSANATKLDALRDAVVPFPPERAADLAGVSATQIVEAATAYAAARFAGIGCGTGPSFSLHGSLTEYLALCLTTLCGFWSRAGDVVQRPNVFGPAFTPRAQPLEPFPDQGGRGEALRVRGLRDTAAGMPTAALAEEILLGGEGQVRALFNLGGNPMMAWPDQDRAFKALQSLDLLVTSDPEMTATARLSDYVIAPKLPLEIPGTTATLELTKYLSHTRGTERGYAQYSERVTQPPAGSDLIEDWELYYGLAQHLGLQIHVASAFGLGRHAEAPPHGFDLDMVDKPSAEDLLEQVHANSRIPLSLVRQYPHGHLFEGEARTIVRPAQPGWTERLDLGNRTMLDELRSMLVADPLACYADDYPFLLVSRRSNRIMNSAGRLNPKLATEAHNPLFLHPADMAQLGLQQGSVVRIRSPHGAILALVEPEQELRRGIASISHGYGGNPGEDDDPEALGCNVGRLMSSEHEFDPFTGIPRMSALPVAIERTPDLALIIPSVDQSASTDQSADAMTDLRRADS
jgi:anaerobic selenocysteine-containing dehydrogenase